MSVRLSCLNRGRLNILHIQIAFVRTAIAILTPTKPLHPDSVASLLTKGESKEVKERQRASSFVPLVFDAIGSTPHRAIPPITPHESSALFSLVTGRSVKRDAWKS